MSDETTLLPCPICGEQPEFQHFNITPSCRGRIVCACGLETRQGANDTEDDLRIIWNTRATTCKLTAEQVRKAIMLADRWEKPMGNTGLTNTHLIIRDDGWQAIADELNATLGGGR